MSTVPSIRMARPEDGGTVAHQRAQMFRDMGVLPDHLVGALRAAAEEQLPALIRAGVYVGWLAEGEFPGEIVAGVGLYLRRVLPRPVVMGSGETGLADREGIVLNAYTEPPYRRRGLARALMSQLLLWTRENAVHRVVLHASVDGRPLYEQLGFEPSNEMRFAWSEASGSTTAGGFFPSAQREGGDNPR